MGSNIERKIYNSWAFSKNELDKRDINHTIYLELIKKYKILRMTDDQQVNAEQLKDYDLVFARKVCYKHAVYKVLKNQILLLTMSCC